MGKTSAAVKRKYNNKAYDRIEINVPKGEKQILQDKAKAAGKSLNQYIVDKVYNVDQSGDSQVPFDVDILLN